MQTDVIPLSSVQNSEEQQDHKQLETLSLVFAAEGLRLLAQPHCLRREHRAAESCSEAGSAVREDTLEKFMLCT